MKLLELVIKNIKRNVFLKQDFHACPSFAFGLELGKIARTALHKPVLAGRRYTCLAFWTTQKFLNAFHTCWTLYLVGVAVQWLCIFAVDCFIRFGDLRSSFCRQNAETKRRKWKSHQLENSKNTIEVLLIPNVEMLRHGWHTEMRRVQHTEVCATHQNEASFNY